LQSTKVPRLTSTPGRNPTKRRKKRRKAPTGISTTTTRITEETARLSGTPTPLPYREKDRFREKIFVHEEELHDDAYIDDPRGPPPPFHEKIPRTPPPLSPPSPPIIDERRERVRYERRENRTPEMHSPRSSNAGRRYREFDAVEREREGGFQKPGVGREREEFGRGSEFGRASREEYRDFERQPSARDWEYERERRGTLR
jgi:hypothetical protein